MSAEIIAIIGTAIAVVSVVLTTTWGLQQYLARIETRLAAKIDTLTATVGDLAHRTSHAEGVVEGLRVAVAATRENPKRTSGT